MPEISDSLVVALGIGIVFIGLVFIVILCKIMSAVCTLANKDDKVNASATAVAPVTTQAIENRQEIIAAVSAVIAEELGTDVSAIRVLSFKKL